MLAAGIALAVASGARAETPAFYLGAWQVASAVAAPWAEGAFPGDTAEMRTLVGKTLTFRSVAIDGPGLLACRKLKYRLVDSTPDMLFQGELAEARDGKPPPNPAAGAAALGFKGSSWKTLETGCGNELDFHFLDEKTAEFGLDNYVYRLEKK